jgi:methylated-DNA-[protein]-cysteine S-methyltransferase
MSANTSPIKPVHTFFLERFNTPTGVMLLVTDQDDGLRALDWETCEERMHRLLRVHYGKDRVRLRQRARDSGARRALDAYFAGDLQAVDALPAAAAGTDFQREVWRALRTISAGDTTTYGALAARIGRPSAARAVGMANGGNPIAIVVPCHRVIGANAALTGYAGGLQRKSWLLAHEANHRQGQP